MERQETQEVPETPPELVRANARRIIDNYRENIQNNMEVAREILNIRDNDPLLSQDEEEDMLPPRKRRRAVFDSDDEN